MGRVQLDRLKDRYGYTGMDYFELVKLIISQGNYDVAQQVYQITDDKYKRLKDDSLHYPDMDKVLGSEDIFLRKAAVNGVLISDTLKTKLEEGLRQVLQHASLNGYLVDEDGAITADVAQDFMSVIQDVFAEYAHREGGEPPSNTRTIAYTETYSTLNMVQSSYAENFAFNNPDKTLYKTWIHRPHLSQEPRENHAMMNNRRVELQDRFGVPVLDKNGTVVDVVWMDHPHDPDAPPQEVINCKCTVKYTVEEAQ